MVWIDEWLVASIVLGFFLGLTLRRVKGDSLKIASLAIEVIAMALIAVATILLALLWFVYLVIGVLTAFVVYSLMPPLWASLKLITLGRKSAEPKMQAPEPEQAPRTTATREERVLKLMEAEWGPGFKPIHAQIVWAMSKGHYHWNNIATFVNRSFSDIADALKFMAKKGVFPRELQDFFATGKTRLATLVRNRRKLKRWATRIIEASEAP